MWRRRIAILFVGMVCAGVAHGQLTKQFFVEDSKDFKKVNLTLKVDFGSCFVKSTQHPGIFNLYSRHGSDQFSHSYSKEINNGECDLKLSLKESQTGGLGQSISNNIFGQEQVREQNNFWKAFLSTEKVYDLRLEYGVGIANIDLSNLAISNLQVHTGSADVNVGYFTEGYNQIEMDTFFVKVDLGNVNVKNLTHAKSNHVIADVGFGNLFLDLSEVPEKKSTVVGNVGAGTLMIFIPSKDTPIKLVIRESWLCRIQLPDSFSKIEKNTYVNSVYTEDAENLLSFNLDVSMGSLIFREKH